LLLPTPIRLWNALKSAGADQLTKFVRQTRGPARGHTGTRRKVLVHIFLVLVWNAVAMYRSAQALVFCERRMKPGASTRLPVETMRQAQRIYCGRVSMHDQLRAMLQTYRVVATTATTTSSSSHQMESLASSATHAREEHERGESVWRPEESGFLGKVKLLLQGVKDQPQKLRSFLVADPTGIALRLNTVRPVVVGDPSILHATSRSLNEDGTEATASRCFYCCETCIKNADAEATGQPFNPCQQRVGRKTTATCMDCCATLCTATNPLFNSPCNTLFHGQRELVHPQSITSRSRPFVTPIAKAPSAKAGKRLTSAPGVGPLKFGKGSG
jgi:hypothetical protein